jgi:hypothetical protein
MPQGLPNEDYLAMVVREFERLKRLAEQAMLQLPPDTFFATPRTSDNSVAVIVKHMGGNMRSRWTDFLAADGEKPGRNRDDEFVIGPNDSRKALMEDWESGWTALFGALAPLREPDLSRTVTIRGEKLSVLQAINRQLTHYAYHVGQIVYVAKHFAGEGWKSLSIARGESAGFNRAPESYLR